MGEPNQSGANGVPAHESELRRLAAQIAELTRENDHLKRELAFERSHSAELMAREYRAVEGELRAALEKSDAFGDLIREIEAGYRRIDG